jgi:hypothetical protein
MALLRRELHAQDEQDVVRCVACGVAFVASVEAVAAHYAECVGRCIKQPGLVAIRKDH